MRHNNQKSINDILDDLSYSFSTPEAETFFYLLKKSEFHPNNAQYKKAEEMLRNEGLTENDITLVFNHFKSEMYTKFNLVPVTENEVVENNDYVMNFYGKIVTVTPEKDENGIMQVYIENLRYQPVKKALQIWKLNKNEKC